MFLVMTRVTSPKSSFNLSRFDCVLVSWYSRFVRCICGAPSAMLDVTEAAGERCSRRCQT